MECQVVDPAIGVKKMRIERSSTAGTANPDAGLGRLSGRPGRAQASRSGAWLTTRSFTLAVFLVLLLLNTANVTQVGRMDNGRWIAYARVPVLLLGLLVLLHQFRGRFIPLLVENLDIAIFVIWAAIGSLISSSPLVSFAYAAWLGATLLLLLILSQCFENLLAMMQALDWALLAGYAVPVLLGILAIPQYLAGDQRLMGDLDTKQMFAWSAVVVIASMVSLANIDRRRQRKSALTRATVTVTVVGVCVLCIALSGNRAAVLGLGIMCLVYALGGTTRLKAFAPYAIALIAGVFVAQSYIRSVTADRYRTLLGQQTLLSSDELRVLLWKANWNYGLEHPVLGGGLVTASVDVAATVPGVPEGFSPHSTYLEIMSEMGVVGLGIFLVLIVRSTHMLWSRREWSSARLHMLILGAPVLLIAAVQSNLTPGQPLFFPLAITLIAPRALSARALPSSHRL